MTNIGNKLTLGWQYFSDFFTLRKIRNTALLSVCVCVCVFFYLFVFRCL